MITVFGKLPKHAWQRQLHLLKYRFIILNMHSTIRRYWYVMQYKQDPQQALDIIAMH